MSYEIQGRTVTLPVEVRRASSWTAQYLVDAGAAQRLIEPAGLRVATIASKAVAVLGFVRYEDGDLDAYNEVAFSILVRRHDAPPGGGLSKALELPTGRVGVYIHRLPVNQTFTLEAGRAIWGYPKFLADIRIAEEPHRTTCTLSHEGRHVLTLSVATRGVPLLPARVVPTYSDAGGPLRMTEWSVRWKGARNRILGGAHLQLGDHEMCEELRSLSLPKRPLLTSFVPLMQANFQAPEVVATASRR